MKLTESQLRQIIREEIHRLHEGTFRNSKEVAVYENPNEYDSEIRIEKNSDGSYYGDADDWDFEAKNKSELVTKLKRWEATQRVAGEKLF